MNSTGIIGLILVAAVGVGAQETTLPAPTGRFAVGTVSRVWSDTTRTDPISGEHKREIVVQIWYPAAPDSPASRAPYIFHLSEESPESYRMLNASVLPNAVVDVPFAADARPAPVIVLSTGRSTSAGDYSTLVEDLASHGYVVVGVNSPHHSRVILPDGTVVRAYQGWTPTREILQQFDKADEFFEPMNATVSGDLMFVVRQLACVSATDRLLAGNLDSSRLGMAGHSNGAMAGSRACAREPRCRAFIGIEGTQTREVRKSGVDKPYALLISEQSLSYDQEDVYREMRTHTRDQFDVFRVDGAGHNTFTDLALTIPGQFSYEIDPRQGVKITRGIVRAFFDEHLRGEKSLDSTARISQDLP